METLYFMFFCLLIAGIIYWALRSDDYAEFNGLEESKKFFLGRKAEDKNPNERTN